MNFLSSLCPGCSLKEYICPPDDEPFPLPLIQALSFLQQLAHAIEHMQERRILHEDLKGENIMLRSDNALELVIVDFGTAERVGPPDFYLPSVSPYFI